MSSTFDNLLRRQDGVISRSQATDLGLSPSDMPNAGSSPVRASSCIASRVSMTVRSGRRRRPECGSRKRSWMSRRPQPRRNAPSLACPMPCSPLRRPPTADRLLDALAARPRIRRRDFLRDVLLDVRDGTYSVLEHHYLTKIERRHRLPKPIRQSRTTVGRHGFRDLEYPDLGVIIELDGRMAHDNALARDRDMERDLDAAVDADCLTLRLGYRQVVGRPCQTTHKMARALRNRGWQGTPTRCPDCTAK